MYRHVNNDYGHQIAKLGLTLPAIWIRLSFFLDGKDIKHVKLLALGWILKFYCLSEITYSEELNLTLQGQRNTIMTLKEAVFKFDLKFTIFTGYTKTCRWACFWGLWMFHDSYGEWTDFFKKTFQ